MPGRYRVIYSPLAMRRMREIAAYIAQDSPEAAERVVDRITDAVDELRLLPYRCPLTRKTAGIAADVRTLVVRPYLVRYRVDEAKKVVLVVAVRHGARSPGL